jgi:hypothetical protein
MRRSIIRRSRSIAGELVRLEYLAPSGQPYGPESVKRMLGMVGGQACKASG